MAFVSVASPLDGATSGYFDWFEYDSAAFDQAYSHGLGRLVACGGNLLGVPSDNPASVQVAASDDGGVTWPHSAQPFGTPGGAAHGWPTTGYGQSVARSEPVGKYVMAGTDFGNQVVCYSTDGVAWSTPTATFGTGTGAYGRQVIWEAPVFVLAGQAPASGAVGNLFKSTDGVAWTVVANPFSGGGISVVRWLPAPLSLWLIVSGVGSVFHYATSPDMVTWTTYPAPGGSVIEDANWDPGAALLVLATFDGPLYTSPDTVTWTAVPLPAGTVNIFAVSPIPGYMVATGNLAGGEANNMLLTVNGALWVPTDVPSPLQNNGRVGYLTDYSWSVITGGAVGGPCVAYGYPNPVLPTAATETATLAFCGEALLNGLVVPNYAPTDWYFQWGPTVALGSVTPTETLPPTYDGVESIVTAKLTGLTAGDTYYYTLVTEDAFGTVEGAMLSFTEATCSPAIQVEFALQ